MGAAKEKKTKKDRISRIPAKSSRRQDGCHVRKGGKDDRYLKKRRNAVDVSGLRKRGEGEEGVASSGAARLKRSLTRGQKYSTSIISSYANYRGGGKREDR